VKTVLQINTVVKYGATGRIAEENGQTAIENGWTSYIAFGRYQSQRLSKSNLIKIGNNWNNYLHAFYTLLFDRHVFTSTKSN